MRRFSTFSAVLTVLAMPLVASAATEMPLRVTKGPAEGRPAMSEGYLAWEQSPDPKRYSLTSVYAQAAGGSPYRVHSKRTFARMGALDGSRLVYSSYRRVDDEGNLLGGDLRLIELAAGARIDLPDGVNTKQEEYAPQISGDWLLFGRASHGRRIRTQLLLHNMATGETRVLEKASGRNRSLTGQLNGSFAVWYSCGRRSCDISRYDIATGQTTMVPNPDGKLQYGPGVAADGTVYFFRSGFGCGTNVLLQKWTTTGATEVVVDFPPGIDAASAYVFEGSGGRQVAYARYRCLKDKYAPPPSDLYHLVD